MQKLFEEPIENLSKRVKIMDIVMIQQQFEGWFSRQADSVLKPSYHLHYPKHNSDNAYHDQQHTIQPKS